MEEWELWYPKAGPAGLYFSKSRIDPADTVIVHSAPDVLSIEVYGPDGSLKAAGKDLPRTADTPMARLTCRGGKIEREDIWPGDVDIGRVVILPGGEAGVLRAWWNAEDYSEWRWEVEFYNKR